MKKILICGLVVVLSFGIINISRANIFPIFGHRSVKVEKVVNVQAVEPVTLITNSSVTEYAEVPNLQLQRIETLAVPTNQVYSTDSCGNSVTLAPNTINTYLVPQRQIVEKIVEVPHRQVVVQKEVVRQQNVVKVKVEHPSRVVEKTVVRSSSY